MNLLRWHLGKETLTGEKNIHIVIFRDFLCETEWKGEKNMWKVLKTDMWKKTKLPVWNWVTICFLKYFLLFVTHETKFCFCFIKKFFWKEKKNILRRKNKFRRSVKKTFSESVNCWPKYFFQTMTWHFLFLFFSFVKFFRFDLSFFFFFVCKVKFLQ